MGHTYALLQVVEITVHESYMRTATRSDVETHDQPTYEHDRISPIFVFGAKRLRREPTPRAHSERAMAHAWRHMAGPCAPCGSCVMAQRPMAMAMAMWAIPCAMPMAMGYRPTE